MSALRVALHSLKLIVSAPRLAFKADPVRYYDFLGDDVIEGESSAFRENKPLWLNLGYWKDAHTYPEAAAAMATLLGDAAQLSARDRQLDVGFGFAEQDFFWLERYGVGRITGLNISSMQVERARARARDRGVSEDRLDLRVGSATEIPFEPGSFDKITALECAHHFPTRERFFQEAFRVLVPGGRLALADGIPQPGRRATFGTNVLLRRWASPLENYYDRDAYREKLLAAGFVNVQIRSIGEHVFPGIVQYMEQRRRGVAMDDATVSLTPENITSGLKAWSSSPLDDYIIVSAEKPALSA